MLLQNDELMYSQLSIDDSVRPQLSAQNSILRTNSGISLAAPIPFQKRVLTLSGKPSELFVVLLITIPPSAKQTPPSSISSIQPTSHHKRFTDSGIWNHAQTSRTYSGFLRSRTSPQFPGIIRTPPIFLLRNLVGFGCPSPVCFCKTILFFQVHGGLSCSL